MTPRIDDRAEAGARLLAEGFARHARRWARPELPAPAQRLVARAAFEVSLATSEGHVCLGLDDLAPRLGVDGPCGLRDALLASGLVGVPPAPGALPLVLDADGRLYLHRYYDHERRLAQRLVRAQQAAPAEVAPATRDTLAQLFAGNALPGDDGPDWQQLAAALALRRRLVVVSGGPGTGKTTTVVNLLACLLTQDPHCRIALAAPTGKAAARMTEAIRSRAVHLPQPLRQRMPAQALTIHRLLGVTARGFRHGPDRPLAVDALVVDEASMLDLALATRLLEAVPETARIVLLGDKDQLAAVEAGAVFAELGADPSLSASCARDLAGLCGVPPQAVRPPAPMRASALHDTAVWFRRNFRFAGNSGIGRLAADINGGRAEAALDGLRRGDDASVRWIDDGAPLPCDATLDALVDGYAGYLEAVRRDPHDRAAVTKAFGAFRALCAVQDGARGVAALNERMTRHARRTLAALAAASGADERSPWWPGRPVMVLRNDYVLKLFNGDVGIALPDGDGRLLVHFPDGEAGFRAVAPVRLPAHQTAFAMTVHKAQGSEFDGVLILLPPQRSPVATRELLYTAVTRARTQATLAAGAEAVSAAIASPTRRRSGLLARLAEAMRHE